MAEVFTHSFHLADCHVLISSDKGFTTSAPPVILYKYHHDHELCLY